MKINKFIKIVVTMLIIALITIITSQVVLAADTKTPATKTYEKIDPSDTGKSVDSYFKQEDGSGASNAVANIIGVIINVAQIVGMGVAIIMLIVLAIQYIAASPEGKAEIKKNSTIYIVGAVILFAASGILGIIRKFAIQNVDNADPAKVS